MFILHHVITTTHAGKFKPTPAPDEYKIKIYVGGRQSEKGASDRALREIEKFLPTHGYQYYTIVKSRYVWLPFSCYEFTIQFKRA
jgi:hypothetical protein